jgi:hypothetical protein
MDTKEDHHGGQLAALCNAWINAAKYHMEFAELKELREKIEQIEEQMGEDE